MTDRSIAPQASASLVQGFICALLAYIMWGLLPLYMKLVAHLPLAEVVAHRIVWSLPIALGLLLLTDRSGAMLKAIRTPRVLMMACLTAGLISLNWTLYVWAIAHDRTLDTALGYYINPLVNVLLGVLFLKERLAKLQVAAIVLAGAAVALLTFRAGGLPWISLALAGSFAIYSYLRKTLPVQALQGFTLEVMILSIPAAAYIVWLTANGQNHFSTENGWGDIGLLILSGPATAVPLILFSIGARQLRLSTIGLMQYLSPTLIFAIAVGVFHEPFSSTQLAAFALIWLGLALFTWSSLRQRRTGKP